MPRLYLDPNRAFGGVLDDADDRLAYYRSVIDAEACDGLRLLGCEPTEGCREMIG